MILRYGLSKEKGTRGLVFGMIGACIGQDHLRQQPRNYEDVSSDVGCGVLDWIELTQVRDRWRALVNAVMNLRLP
jgi:hypothetical protein